jgi:hypothetical protein
VIERYIAARLDRAALVRSTLTLVGIACVLILIFLAHQIMPVVILLAGPVLLLPLAAYAATPMGYGMDERTLWIERKAFRTVRVPLGSISDVRPLPAASLHGAIRVYGTGGLFGWAGRYRLRGLGAVSMHATNLERLILVQRRGRRPLLISPADPDAFLRGLRRQYETIVVPPRRTR